MSQLRYNITFPPIDPKCTPFIQLYPPSNINKNEIINKIKFQIEKLNSLFFSLSNISKIILPNIFNYRKPLKNSTSLEKYIYFKLTSLQKKYQICIE